MDNINSIQVEEKSLQTKISLILKEEVLESLNISKKQEEDTIKDFKKILGLEEIEAPIHQSINSLGIDIQKTVQDLRSKRPNSDVMMCFFHYYLYFLNHIFK